MNIYPNDRDNRQLTQLEFQLKKDYSKHLNITGRGQIIPLTLLDCCMYSSLVTICHNRNKKMREQF